jgi:hypothetical protein
MKQEDLCKTCVHYWFNFPLTLDYIEPRCEIVDEKYGYDKMNEKVPYPCIECPFNSYSKNK